MPSSRRDPVGRASMAVAPFRLPFYMCCRSSLSVHVDAIPGREPRELLPENPRLGEVTDQAPTTAPHVGADPPVRRGQRVEVGDQDVQIVAHHRQPIPADPTQIAATPTLADRIVEGLPPSR